MYAMGNALAIGLRKGLVDAGVPVEYGTELRDLLVEDGRVVGVTVLRQGVERTIRATPRRDPRQRRLREEPRAARAASSPSPRASTGRPAPSPTPAAGHLAGMAAGADVALMDDAWWGPTIPLPRGPWFALAERNLPGLDHRQLRRQAVHERGAAVRRGGARDLQGRGDRRLPRARRGWSSTSATATATCSPASRRASRSRGVGTSSARSRRPTPSRRSPRRSRFRRARCAATVDRFNGFATLGRRRGLPPRRERLRQVLLRPHREAEPVPAQHRPGAVLRREDRAG